MSDWRITTDGRHYFDMPHGQQWIVAPTSDAAGWSITMHEPGSDMLPSDFGVVFDTLDRAKAVVIELAGPITDCRPRCQCGSTATLFEQAGHLQCPGCGRNVGPCCDGAPS